MLGLGGMEWAALGVIAGLASAGTTILAFWIRFSDRISKAEAHAEAAEDAAKEAKSIALEAHDKLAVQTAAFALYREQVAREYIHREVMREVEDRLTAAIERLGDRMDRVLEVRGEHNPARRT